MDINFVHVNMETKEIKVQVPEGYEIDRENSTFECIKLKEKPKTAKTYLEVARRMFFEKETYFIDQRGKIDCSVVFEDLYGDPNNCATMEQAEKLLAINKMMTVARYLNDGWKPDFKSDTNDAWCIELNEDDEIEFCSAIPYYNNTMVYFKDEEAAAQCVNILGEEVIRKAMSNDWLNVKVG